MNWNIRIENLNKLNDAQYEHLHESLKKFVAVSREHKQTYSVEYITKYLQKSTFFTEEERKDRCLICFDNPTAQTECYQFLEKNYPQLFFYDEEDAGPSFHGDTVGGPRSQVTNFRNKKFLSRIHKGEK